MYYGKMAKPAHRTIIYSMYVLHVPDPEVGLILMCSNPCLLHLKLLKIVLILTATNVLTMGTKSGYIHCSAPSILEHLSNAELH